MRKRLRRIKRGLRDRRVVFLVFAFLAMGALSYATYMQNKRLVVDPSSCAALLQLIAQAESKDNYNAHFGNVSNVSIDFTKMSIAEVMKWQAEYVNQGHPSNAVGRYQIISTTLDGLVRQLGVDTKQKFDQTMQDKMALALLERRGIEKYINKELTRDQFAANLAKEWAGLPKVIGDNPGDSYYASDGLNKSLVSVEEVLGVIAPISHR